MSYSASFAKEERIYKAARRMGYKNQREMASALGQPFILGAVLDVSGGTERQLIDKLEKHSGETLS